MKKECDNQGKSFRLPLENIQELGREENLPFIGVALFQILHKRSLLCKDMALCKHDTHYGSQSGFQYYNLTTLHLEIIHTMLLLLISMRGSKEPVSLTTSVCAKNILTN